MTKETYLAIIVIYTIEKVREASKLAGSEPFIHTAAIKHHDAEAKLELLKGKRSNSYVARKLGVTVRWVQKLRKMMRDRRKKKPGRKK